MCEPVLVRIGHEQVELLVPVFPLLLRVWHEAGRVGEQRFELVEPFAVNQVPSGNGRLETLCATPGKTSGPLVMAIPRPVPFLG
jgi:hypothetical protein